MQYHLALVSMVTMVSLVTAFPGGPPTTACSDMKPNHGPEPQTSEPLFKVEVSAQCFNDGDMIRVTVKRVDEWDDDHFFRGFFVQARNAMNLWEEMSYGEFVPEDNDDKVQTLNCPNGMNNAISHTSRENKFMASFMWKAPDPYSMEDIGTLQFVATVVHTQDIFWTFIESPKITYGCDGAPEPEGEGTPEPESESESESESVEMTDWPMPPSAAVAMEMPVALLLGTALLARLALR